MGEKVRIGVVIVNYCSFDDVRDCVASITPSQDVYCYIVDNNSPDNSKKFLLEKYEDNERIQVICNPKNSGYAVGNNIGIKRAIEDECSFVVISNPDILFYPDTIEKMIEGFETSSDVGIVGPSIFDTDRNLYEFGQRRKRTGLKELLLLKYPLNKSNILNSKKSMFLAKCDHSSPKDVFSVSGCCFAMSCDVANKVSFFDENTFMFLEETILGIKLDKADYRVLYYPKSKVIHNHKKSPGYVNPVLLINKYRSEMYYCKEYLNCSHIEMLPLRAYYAAAFLFSCVVFDDYRKKLVSAIRTRN